MSNFHSKYSGNLRGIAAVAGALELEDFPATKQDLYYAVGDIEVENRNGSYTPMRKVLDRIEQNEFATVEDALGAIRDKAA